MNTFHSFVPKKSHKLLQCWVDELKIDVRISNPRKTKLGDFKVINDVMCVSVNNDLNPYSFLITLTHELAHAFVYLEYKSLVAPHANEWKSTFRSMMLNFLNPEIFPSDILSVLSLHMKSPKASTLTDLSLSLVLRKYDSVQRIAICDIEEGSVFSICNERRFKKGERLRKRYKCIDQASGKIYLFHPLAEVLPL